MARPRSVMKTGPLLAAHLASPTRRVCVSATSDHGGGLLGVALPERRCWRAMQGEVLEIDVDEI